MIQRSGLLSANKDVELTFCNCDTRSLCSHPGYMGVLANGFVIGALSFTCHVQAQALLQIPRLSRALAREREALQPQPSSSSL